MSRFWTFWWFCEGILAGFVLMEYADKGLIALVAVSAPPLLLLLRPITKWLIP